MTKGYLFPKRRLRANEILEPDGLNEDFIPATARASGRYNEHNFNAAQTRANIAPAVQAYYKPHYVYKSADPHFGTWGAYTVPDALGGPDSAWQIPNSFDWAVVDSMTLTFSTGNAALWIVGWLQYIWLGFNNGNHAYSTSTYPAHVQFAIQVDGSIIEGTITGQKDMNAMAWHVAKATPQRTSSTLLPGPQVNRGIGDNASCGPECIPVRVGCHVPVPQGSHTIDLIARRISASDSDIVYGGSDTVYVYNRKLFALETYVEEQSASTSADVTVDNFEPESSFSAATVQTARINTIRVAENAVVRGSAARGAFNHNHLPKALIDKHTVMLAPNAAKSINCRYPGFTSNTVTIIPIAVPPQPANTGWYLVQDPAGNGLISNNGHGSFNITSQKSFIFIMANVQLRRIYRAATNPIDQFAAFSLGVQITAPGAFAILDDTICFVNSYTWDPNVTDPTEVEFDVTLFTMLDYTGALGLNNLDFIGVYASSMEPTSNPVTISWQAGNLIVLQFRD